MRISRTVRSVDKGRVRVLGTPHRGRARSSAPPVMISVQQRTGNPAIAFVTRAQAKRIRDALDRILGKAEVSMHDLARTINRLIRL